MAGTIITHTTSELEIPYEQIIRYAGMLNGEVPDAVDTLIKKCLPIVLGAVKYKACYLEVPVAINEKLLNFDCFCVSSKNLSSLLRGCEKAILVAATVGIEIDMLIKRAEVTSKAEALILNSIAIAAIEKYMAELNLFFKDQYKGFELRPRFSPGYGDLPLDIQKELLATLDTKRKIGVALTDSLLMTPTKSVSAIIGIGEEGCIHIDKDCDLCSKRDCEFRLS